MYRVNRLILDLDMMPADLGVMTPLLLSTFAETDFRGVDKVDVVVAVAVCCCCCCCMLLPLFFFAIWQSLYSSKWQQWQLGLTFGGLFFTASICKQTLTHRPNRFGDCCKVNGNFSAFFFIFVWRFGNRCQFNEEEVVESSDSRGVSQRSSKRNAGFSGTKTAQTLTKRKLFGLLSVSVSVSLRC